MNSAQSNGFTAWHLNHLLCQFGVGYAEFQMDSNHSV